MRDRTAGAGGFFAALGRMVVRHPWRVIALWVIAAVAIIATAPALPTTTNESSFLPSSYESIRAANLQDKAFPQAGNVTADAAIIVFARSDGQKLTSADSAKVASIAAELNSRHIKNILSVTAGPASPNKLVQTALVSMNNNILNGTSNAAGDAIKVLRADIKPLMQGSGLSEGVTGTAAQQLDSQQSGNNAEKIVTIATLALILILLLVIFRSPIIAFLPLIVIAVVSQVATGLISDVNSALHLNADSSVTTLLIVVLFGIGTDYILFLMFRYRERLRLGDDPKLAMVNAVHRVGEVIASAAGVVIVAFLALLLSTLSLFRSLGPTLAIAVAVTLVAGLTLVPAVVSLLGPKVFWPSKAWRREPKGARFAAIGRAVGRRPAVFALVSGLVLVALAVGALSFKPTFDLASAGISSNAESVTALKTLEKGLPPGATDPTQIYLHANSGSLSAAEVTAYGAKLKTMPGVGAVAPAHGEQGRGHRRIHRDAVLQPGLHHRRERAQEPVAAGRARGRPAGHLRAGRRDHRGLRRHPAGGEPRLRGGVPCRRGDHLAHPRAAAAQRGGPVVPDGLGRAGFRRDAGGHGAGVPDPGRSAGLVFLLPIYMYLFVVALGTDYNILMIARLREEARQGMNPHDAAAHAIRQSGPTIGAAGLILAARSRR